MALCLFCIYPELICHDLDVVVCGKQGVRTKMESRVIFALRTFSFIIRFVVLIFTVGFHADV